jgi:2-polyprenyl-6-methoxyphenol hydroxylase-like FAD-dependent oxidoreductase
VRRLHDAQFGTRLATGRNPYIWLGTDKVFERFTFAFRWTPAGWIWFHAYPSIAGISTCIVECPPQTWHGLGLGGTDPDGAVRLLERVFAGDLDGHPLISASRGEPAQWTHFTQVTNLAWHHGNVVLAGDAAHTTHFTIGSGTNLAITDATVLARCVYEHEDLPTALLEYERDRKAALHQSQATARTSMTWFESVPEYLDRDVVAFAYAMLARDGYAPPWSYQVLRASQVPALRRAQRLIHSGRRWYRARRRGESLLTQGRRLAPGDNSAPHRAPAPRKP